jgi:hypothetical protein
MELNIVSRRTETAYKAEEADEVAQHAEVRDGASTVNAAVVQLEFASLSGETCRTCVPATESVGASYRSLPAVGMGLIHKPAARSGQEYQAYTQQSQTRGFRNHVAVDGKIINGEFSIAIVGIKADFYEQVVPRARNG